MTIKHLLILLIPFIHLQKADAKSQQYLFPEKQQFTIKSIKNDSTKQKIRHSVFLEGLGNSYFGSLNYNIAFPLKSQLYLNTRVGFLYVSKKHEYPHKSLNAEISLSYGKKHSLVFGIGGSYVYGWGSCTQCDIPYVSEKLLFIIKPAEYKFQKKSSGFFFSASGLVIIQIHEYNNFLREKAKKEHASPIIGPHTGISIGYTL